ncbi:outer membrane protein, cobalt-zinc-cadmium efflux system [Duganella sacchari]|uniref:Outer membrane protein, cobalt-zinc-cadmium efflux system n=1 Tax=Duganella sacchari TaxID=551987 RepID=A0A1M7RBI7_9BURK|nr:TolC family protein [Duganella sacchari]SHN43492.1 outer membrane protein, cobalt-zinc-cadmium efflux system [Duganella sacchari]
MQKISVRPRALSRGRSSDLAVRRTVLSFLLATAAALSQAVEAPSFAALLQQSQANAPQLLEQAANVRAASADARQAGAWLNPTISATAENLGAPRSGGVSQRQDTYTVTQVFELGGKRTARIAAEQRKFAAAGARERQVRLAFAGELAVAYATAEAMQQRRQVADAELGRADDDLRAAQALVKAGREAELRLALARAGVAAAQAAVQSASADAIEALERLSALAGAAEPYTSIGQPFLASVATPRPQPDWRPGDAPALASATAERDAVSAQVQVEQKRWLPDLGVSVGMRKFGWSDDKAATVALTANIPLFDRNQAGIDAAKERATSASMRLEAVRLEAVSQHRSASAQVQAAERRLLAAQQGEAAATEAYRLGRVGYDAGKTALVELLAIRRALSEATALAIEARLARVRALATLSLAQGRNLFGEAP